MQWIRRRVRNDEETDVVAYSSSSSSKVSLCIGSVPSSPSCEDDVDDVFDDEDEDSNQEEDKDDEATALERSKCWWCSIDIIIVR